MQLLFNHSDVSLQQKKSEGIKEFSSNSISILYLCIMEQRDSISLNKFISDNGICSRRQADKYIDQGSVYVNGKKAKVADRVHPGDQVRINGIELDPVESIEKVYIVLNKPVGITCTTERQKKDNIVDFVNHTSRVFPIGRLDKDSQGLILLTNDGNIVNKILRAEHQHEKEYEVEVDKPITKAFIDGMAGGVPILGTVTKKCKVVATGNRTFRITLIQGLNRQIRRMCAYFGYEVISLTRTRIMHITMKGIGNGEWRELDKEETEKLLQVIAHVKTNSYKAKNRKSSGKSSGSKPTFAEIPPELKLLYSRRAQSSAGDTLKPTSLAKKKPGKSTGTSRPEQRTSDSKSKSPSERKETPSNVITKTNRGENKKAGTPKFNAKPKSQPRIGKSKVKPVSPRRKH